MVKLLRLFFSVASFFCGESYILLCMDGKIALSAIYVFFCPLYAIVYGACFFWIGKCNIPYSNK